MIAVTTIAVATIANRIGPMPPLAGAGPAFGGTVFVVDDTDGTADGGTVTISADEPASGGFESDGGRELFSRSRASLIASAASPGSIVSAV